MIVTTMGTSAWSWQVSEMVHSTAALSAPHNFVVAFHMCQNLHSPVAAGHGSSQIEDMPTDLSVATLHKGVGK